MSAAAALQTPDAGTAPASMLPGNRPPFAAFVSDETTLAVLQRIARSMGWDADAVASGGVARATKALGLQPSPVCLVIDLSDSADPLTAINELADVCEPGTGVVALGTANDVGLYRDLIASGLSDYLVKPVSEDNLREVIVAAQEAMVAEPPAEDGAPADHKAIGILGVRGGVGASTLAANLSWLIADRFARTTALLDLDMHFGTAALAFDLEPGRGLTDAIASPDRVDGLFLERAMVKATENLAVLASEAPLADPMMPDPSALEHLKEVLVQTHQVSVIDVPRSLAVALPSVLTGLDQILLVADASLACTRDCIRTLAFLKTAAPETPVKLVVNKVPPANKTEVPLRDFAASVERPVDHALPEDPKGLLEAMRQGKVLTQCAHKTKLAQALSQLAVSVLGEAPPKKAFSLTKWVMGK